MSGHSKWSKIKHQKAIGDVSKGLIFTKIANAITIAVREHGGNVDPETNFRLRLLIDKAKSANIPKDNINRAIERGSGKGAGNQIEEIIYEGYGPGGIAILIEAVTDNRARTTSEIKNIFDKSGGKLGEPGSVVFLFNPLGLITTQKTSQNIDEIMMLAIDNGATDVEEDDNKALIYTKQEQLMEIKKTLEEKGIPVESAEEILEPFTTIRLIQKEDTDAVISLIDKFEQRDDVQKVYSNFDVNDPN